MFKPQTFPASPQTEADHQMANRALASLSACKNSCSMAEAERALSEARSRMQGLHSELLGHLVTRRYAVNNGLAATARVAVVSMRLAKAQYSKARRQAIEARAALESLQDARATLRHIMGEDLP